MLKVWPRGCFASVKERYGQLQDGYTIEARSSFVGDDPEMTPCG